LHILGAQIKDMVCGDNITVIVYKNASAEGNKQDSRTVFQVCAIKRSVLYAVSVDQRLSGTPESEDG